MQYIIFEDVAHDNLLPLTFTRPVYELQIGIFTFKERWEEILQADVGTHAVGYLAQQWQHYNHSTSSIWLNGRLAPDEEFKRLINDLEPGRYYIDNKGTILTFKLEGGQAERASGKVITQEWLEEMGLQPQLVSTGSLAVNQLTDLYFQVAKFIQYDFLLVTAHQLSKPIKDTYTAVYGKDNIFVAPGARIHAAVLHAEEGPIYIGEGVQIQPGALVWGAHSLGRNSTVAMGAKLRGNTSTGAYAKIGGEVKNSLIGAYSNKGHEGYLGNSVLGVGCNLGADTNVSNMKNTLNYVKQWNYVHKQLVDTQQQFCGTIMGDYSRSAIHTTFNTGTVVGVSAHVFGAGFPPKFIPSFSWGGAEQLDTYRLPAAIDTLHKFFELKKYTLTTAEISTLEAVYQSTKEFRSWEKP